MSVWVSLPISAPFTFDDLPFLRSWSKDHDPKAHASGKSVCTVKVNLSWLCRNVPKKLPTVHNFLTSLYVCSTRANARARADWAKCLFAQVVPAVRRALMKVRLFMTCELRVSTHARMRRQEQPSGDGVEIHYKHRALSLLSVLGFIGLHPRLEC